MFFFFSTRHVMPQDYKCAAAENLRPFHDKPKRLTGNQGAESDRGLIVKG